MFNHTFESVSSPRTVLPIHAGKCKVDFVGLAGSGCWGRMRVDTAALRSDCMRDVQHSTQSAFLRFFASRQQQHSTIVSQPRVLTIAGYIRHSDINNILFDLTDIPCQQAIPTNWRDDQRNKGNPARLMDVNTTSTT